VRWPADVPGAARRWLIPLLLAGAILAAYGNTFDVPFVFDD